MEINKIRIAFGIEHHVASLEIAVEETLEVLLSCEISGKEAEVGLKLELVEVEFSRLKKAIFEIVEVEEHTFDIKLGLWVALAPI